MVLDKIPPVCSGGIFFEIFYQIILKSKNRRIFALAFEKRASSSK
jgi:hypothetical protein